MKNKNLKKAVIAATIEDKETITMIAESKGYNLSAYLRLLIKEDISRNQELLKGDS